jgi:hypothetical protein
MKVSRLNNPCIPFNGTVLTLGSGKMSNVVFATLFGHHIFEVGGKISSTMPLEQIVEQDGVIYSICVSHKNETSRCRACKLTSRHVVVIVIVVVINSLQGSSGGL